MPELSIVKWVLSEAMHGLNHIEQTHLVRIQHRAATEDGEAVACQVNHVDVAGLACNAFLQYMSGFIDQGKHQSLHNFFVCYFARRDAF